MVNRCCITGCKSEWNPQSDVTFHSFPLKRETVLRKWNHCIPTGKNVSKYSRICSNHFTNRSFVLLGGKKFLKKDAVPTLFKHDVLRNINAEGGKTSPITRDADLVIRLSSGSYPEKTDFECVTANTPESETSVHNEEVVHTSQKDSDPEGASFECKIAETHISELSLHHEAVVQISEEDSHPEEARFECETAETHPLELPLHHEEVIQLSQDDSQSTESSFECEPRKTHPELSPHHEEVIQLSQDDSQSTESIFEHETAKTHPELSPHHVGATGNRDVATQTLPCRIPPSDREKKLKNKIKSLQARLRRKEKAISKAR